MATTPVRSPTIQQTSRMRKDESFLGKLGGTLARKKKAREVSDLQEEGKNAINAPMSPTPTDIHPEDTLLEENEERTMIEPYSKEEGKFKELVKVLIDWINDVLVEERIIVKSLEEDLYDGQVLQKLLEKLASRKLNVAEVTQSEIGQKQKLQTVLESVNNLLRPQGWAIKWSVDLIHTKNTVAILHLLVALAMHFRAPVRLPEHVSVQLVVVRKREGILHTSHVTEEFTSTTEMMMGRFERDAFDTLFDHAPDKLSVVKKSLITFVNKHLNKLNLEVTELETQFADGVYLVLLMGLLEDYFVPLYNFYLTPESFEQKVHNVSFSFELMQDGGLKKPKARPEGEMDSSFANLVAGFEEFKESTKIDIPLGERRKFIQPASLKSSKLAELMTLLIDWINATLKQDHIVVKSLEEDLYDGLVLHHLIVHLGEVKLDIEEIALSDGAQKQKLSAVLDRVNQLLEVAEDHNLNWNVDLIHNKDLIATLHLLVAIAKHFRPDIPLPGNVCLETLTLEIDKTGIKTTKHLEYITEKRDDEEQKQTPEADNINDLFNLGPDKIKVVQQALLHFVNKHLGGLGVTVKDLGAQFSNGVILILLMGQLEGYFIHLSEYYLSPSDEKEKLHNVSFVLALLEERGLLHYPINPQDIVNLDTKATIRTLHCLFAKYKDK